MCVPTRNRGHDGRQGAVCQVVRLRAQAVVPCALVDFRAVAGILGILDDQSADGWNRAKTPEATRLRAPMDAKIAI